MEISHKKTILLDYDEYLRLVSDKKELKEKLKESNDEIRKMAMVKGKAYYFSRERGNNYFDWYEGDIKFLGYDFDKLVEMKAEEQASKVKKMGLWERIKDYFDK